MQLAWRCRYAINKAVQYVCGYVYTCIRKSYLFLFSTFLIVATLQTVKSHDQMAQAMKGVTKAMSAMNKKVNMPGLQKIMTEFMKENERADMTAEMIGDTIDDAMEEEGSAEQEDMIVRQVLDELGVNLSQELSEAPDTKVPSKESKVEQEGSKDEAMTSLEARLNNLKTWNSFRLLIHEAAHHTTPLLNSFIEVNCHIISNFEHISSCCSNSIVGSNS